MTLIDAQPPVLGDHELHHFLAEDVAFGDLTTESLGIAARPGRIRFFARDPMVVCGVEEAVRLFQVATPVEAQNKWCRCSARSSS
jgi:molybdenum transport protein